MGECVSLPTCPFFEERLKDLPSLSELYRQQYCLEGGESCARAMVRDALGSGKIPADLYPTQRERARRLIAATQAE